MKKETKKNSKILTTVIVLVILAIGGYLLNNKLNEDLKENKSDEKQEEKLQLTQTEVNDLYAKIYTLNGYKAMPSFYMGEKITFNELSDVQKLYAIITEVMINNKPDFSYEEETTFTEFKDLEKYQATKLYTLFNNQTLLPNNMVFLAIYDESIVEKELKKFFGDDAVLPKITLNQNSDPNLFACRYIEYSQSNNQYLYYATDCNPLVAIGERRIYSKYEIKDNTLEIYDYYSYFENGIEYKENQKKNIISQNMAEEKNINEYGQLYKHIFKQNSNGELYWYSSEPVNNN